LVRNITVGITSSTSLKKSFLFSAIAAILPINIVKKFASFENEFEEVRYEYNWSSEVTNLIFL